MQNALHDISSTNDHTDPQMEVDGDRFNVDIGAGSDDNDSNVEATNASESIIVDIRDIVGFKRWHGKRKYKGQSWKERLRQFNNAWAELIDELVDHFILWKHHTPEPSPSTAPEESNTWDFTIDVVDVYSLTHQATIHRDQDTTAASALVRAGYLPASPVSPSLAVSLRTLELFYTLRLFKPNLSVEAFTKAVCHLYSVRKTVFFTLGRTLTDL